MRTTNATIKRHTHAPASAITSHHHHSDCVSVGKLESISTESVAVVDWIEAAEAAESVRAVLDCNDVKLALVDVDVDVMVVEVGEDVGAGKLVVTSALLLVAGGSGSGGG